MRLSYLHYLTNYLYGTTGASIHVREFVTACRTIGHDVTVLRHGRQELPVGVPLASRTRRYPSWLSRWLHEPRCLAENVACFQETRWMQRAKPECVIMRYAFGRASGGLAARRTGIPWLLEVNAPYEPERRQLGYYWRLPGACQSIERWLVRSADVVTVVSRPLYDYYRHGGVPSGKLAVVPNGVDADQFRPDLNSEDIRRQLGLNGRCVMGFVGVFYPWHGLEGLEYLMETLLPQVPDLALVLIGDGPERQRLEQTAARLRLGRRVVFTGRVEHAKLPQYLASLDIALAPYKPSDLFYFSPVKLFEYLASGRPVVAAAIGQIREIIRDGENGLLFDPGDWQAFASQIRRYVTDRQLREHCAQQARQTVLARYTWRHVAQRVMALAERVVARHPHPAEDR